MKRLLLVVLAAAAALALPGVAAARPDRGTIGQCGLPSRTTWWIDFGTPDLLHVFGKPGLIVTSSSGDFPAKVRATGAHTMYWDMNFNRRVGTPSAPADPSVVVDRANRLFDFAAQQSACEKPLIVLNELFGASLETPWTQTNAQYRENVLTFLRTLSGRGARSFLLISSTPYTASNDAEAWWKHAAAHADLVPEVYFSAPPISQQGPVVGSRRLRTAMRDRLQRLTAIGIPPSKLGIVLGFHTGRGGGRAGLKPREAWLEYVKLNVLAARQIVRETAIATVFSWGWAPYSGADADREAAACVYLWTRDARLCDGPRAGGPRFNASLTEGQLRLAGGRQCTVGRRAIEAGTLAGLQRLTGDREVAYTALLARVAEAPYASVPTKRVLAAERAVIALRFNGSRGAYNAALARAGASVGLARGILADELRRAELEAGMSGRRPSAAEVSAFYFSYPELLVRTIEAKPGPWWLGGKKSGLALAALAPERVFALRTGVKAKVGLFDGTYTIVARDEARPLGTVPFEQARAAIAAALRAFARRASFDDWTIGRQTYALQRAICRRDELPAPGAVRLSAYLPFLALS